MRAVLQSMLWQRWRCTSAVVRQAWEETHEYDPYIPLHIGNQAKEQV